MTCGKKTCKILKEIRQQIAEKNDIEYITSECHFQGECKGTCPKCEAELRYLENELHKRQQLGKVVTIAGIALGVVGAAAANEPPNQGHAKIFEQKIFSGRNSSSMRMGFVPPYENEATITIPKIFKPKIINFEYSEETTRIIKKLSQPIQIPIPIQIDMKKNIRLQKTFPAKLEY